ncbi:MAG: NYN domain-containing protein [Proteobacteria bacterium]|nr:NYN domain-containing protein [Pseudomonadota bacterium]
MEEPDTKRAVAFFDGQNLYRHAKDAFGYHHPNYDITKLHAAVCAANGWTPFGIRFYTGTPSSSIAPMWHHYWSSRLLAMRRAGIYVYSRPIRYRVVDITLPDGSVYEVDLPQEKGIDVHLALDIMRLAMSNQLDVAVVFSQDQDLAEVADELREISRSADRWLKMVSAFPTSSAATTHRGIDKTDWFKMDKAFYDANLDPHDYRSKSFSTPAPAKPSVRLKTPAPTAAAPVPKKSN